MQEEKKQEMLRQSYLSVVASASLTMYEQRLLLMCVQFAQKRLQGISLTQEHRVLEHTFNCVELNVNIADVLSEGTAHYNHVLRAAAALTKRTFKYKDKEGNEVVTVWILRATHVARSGALKLLLDKTFFDCLYNFRKGFCYYDLVRAMQLKHPQSVKLYQLTNGMQKGGVTYSIEGLKRVFGVEDKYKRANDFVKKYIDVAQKELEASGEGNYFKYSIIKKGKGKTAAIEGIHFVPIKRATSLEIQSSASGVRTWLPSDFFSVLIQHAAFTTRQINANKNTFLQLSSHPLGMPMLLDIIQRARRTRPANLQGYIVNAVKSELKQSKAAAPILYK